MKQLFKLWMVATFLFVVGCSKEYDDAEVWNSINSLEERMSAMETVMNAYKNNLLIKSVDQVEGGYVITFSDGSQARIMSTVVSDSTDKNNKSYIKEITIGDDEVTFILTDGNTFSISLYNALSIIFEKESLNGVNPNSMKEIFYSIKSALPNVEVEVVSSSDIKAKVVCDSENNLTGKIVIQTSDIIDEYSKVVVFVSNGEKVIMRRITFEEAGLIVEENATKQVTAEGGEMTLEFLSNVECEVVIPEDAQSWISIVPAARAMEKQTITLSIKPNSGGARVANVLVQSLDGVISLCYKIEQPARSDYQLALEREALIALYNALDGDNWEYKDNWCSEKPVGLWSGISTNTEGFVTGIHFNSNNLQGELPYELTSLKSLRLLDLSYNSISSIPIWISELDKLEVLRFEGCGLTGPFPEGIVACQNLKYLSLAYNKLEGPLPEKLGEMKHLFFVHLESNKFSGEIPSTIEKNQTFWPANWWQILNRNHFDAKKIQIPAPAIVAQDIQGNTIKFMEEYAKSDLTLIYEFHADLFFDENNQHLHDLIKRIQKRYKNSGLRCIGIASGTGYPDNTRSIYNETLDFVKKEGMVDDGWKIIVNGGVDGEEIVLAHGIIPTWVGGEEDKIISWLHPALPEGGMFTTTLVDKQGLVVWSNSYPDVNKLFANQRDMLGVINQYLGVRGWQNSNVTLLQEASVGRGIDLIVMGDAFSESSISSGMYEKKLREAVEALFSEEPYTSFRSLFNVYMVEVRSDGDGYETGDSALGGYFGDGTHVGAHTDLTISYALEALEAEERLNNSSVLVVMNSQTHDGTCWYMTDYENQAIMTISYCSLSESEDFRGLVLHELGGHGIGLLGDEYAYAVNGSIPSDEVTRRKQAMIDWGVSYNVDFTNDPKTVKWAHFLRDERYANEGLGCYEGGLTYWSGVWRPTVNSIMRYNWGGFNAPSREAIYKRIHRLAYGDSWVYDYETFVEWDARNRAKSTASRAMEYRPIIYKPTHPPVIVN